MTNEGLDLKHCVFCGNTGETMNHSFLGVEKDEYGKYYVQCYCCDSQGPYQDTKEKAIERWNLRFYEVD